MFQLKLRFVDIFNKEDYFQLKYLKPRRRIYCGYDKGHKTEITGLCLDG